MGYPTIDKFDLRFIERTLENVKLAKNPNKFTHLINSLVGLIFLPHEFNKKGKRTYTVDFLNKPLSDYELLAKIFSGEVDLTDEKGKHFKQAKFYRKDRANNNVDIKTTTVGELVRLFRNGIAHQNIIPVGEGGYWKGIIVRNYTNEKSGDYNFETFLNQKELREFATLIATEYLNHAKK
jgi:hypothetical protein